MKANPAAAACLRILSYAVYLLFIYIVFVSLGASASSVDDPIKAAGIQVIRLAVIAVPVVAEFLSRMKLHIQETLPPDSTLTTYTRERNYWLDRRVCHLLDGMSLLILMLVLFARWRSFIIIVIPPVVLRIFIAVWGHYHRHPGLRDAKRLLKGEKTAETWTLALIKNHTDEYLSSFSSLPDRKAGKYLLAFDWNWDVKQSKYVTSKGIATLRERCNAWIPVCRASDPGEAETVLRSAVEELLDEAAGASGALLKFILVTPEDFSVELPKDFSYIAQASVTTVRSLQDVSLSSLLSERYNAPGMLDNFELRLNELKKPARQNSVLFTKELNRSCLALYSHYPTELVLWLTSGETAGPASWNPTLREFYRGIIAHTSELTSFMALMDYMDLVLRLCLYTLMAQSGDRTISRETIPDDFAQLGNRIASMAQPNTPLWEGVFNTGVPCRLPAVLIGMEQILYVKLEGQEFRFLGLCDLLYYIRNKTRGHGSVQDNVGILWAFALEASLALSRFLRLDIYSFDVRLGLLWAGWDKEEQLVLDPLAYPKAGCPIVAFDPGDRGKKQKDITYIDYFHGRLVTPSWE